MDQTYCSSSYPTHTHTHAHICTCTLKLSKKDKIYKRMIFIMLNIKKKSLRHGENQGESYNSSMFTALREFANIHKRGTQAKPSQLTELKSLKWDLERPKILETAGQSTERTKLEERIVEIQRVPQGITCILTSYAYEETAWSLGKNHPPKLKVTVFKAHTG